MNERMALDSIIDDSVKNESPAENRIIETIGSYSLNKISYKECREILLHIYCPDDGKEYRHRYGLISRRINAIEDQREYLIEGCDKLSAALENDKEEEFKNRIEYLVKSINKLRDHIDLELFRQEVDSERTKQIQELNNTSQELTNKLTVSAKKLEDQENISMAVMGMFTGIIMTFSGGLTILGTAFSEIQKANFTKLAFLVAFVGMIFFNVLFGIFYFTGKLAKKPIHTRCQIDPTSTCEECKVTREDNWKIFNTPCGFGRKIKRKYPYLIVINLLFFVLMAFAIFLGPIIETKSNLGIVGESTYIEKQIPENATVNGAK